MHSCGVTRIIRKGYAIASFHSFGSFPQALTLKQQKSKAQGHQLAPLCDENSSLRAQRNLGIAEPGGSALAHIGGFAAQQEVVARRREEIDHLAVFAEPSLVLRTSWNDHDVAPAAAVDGASAPRPVAQPSLGDKYSQ